MAFESSDRGSADWPSVGPEILFCIQDGYNAFVDPKVQVNLDNNVLAGLFLLSLFGVWGTKSPCSSQFLATPEVDFEMVLK